MKLNFSRLCDVSFVCLLHIYSERLGLRLVQWHPEACFQRDGCADQWEIVWTEFTHTHPIMPWYLV